MLNFLKELPDRYLVLMCFFVILAAYFQIRSDAILQLLLNFGVAIIALSTKKSQPTTEINTETVKTPAVHTDTIIDSTVNTESLNVKNKEDK